jgi:hypothetical protein
MSLHAFTLRRSFAALALIAVSFPVLAQQPPTPSRVRGTIEKVDGDILDVKSRSGEDFKLHMTGDLRVVGIAGIALSDSVPSSAPPRCRDLTAVKTRSRSMCFRKTCAVPAKVPGRTICVPTAP